MKDLMADAGVELRADARRVIARLYFPGESMPGSPSRTEEIVERVLAAAPEEVSAAAAEILQTFGPRDEDLELLLQANAAVTLGGAGTSLTRDQTVVLGATFTAEYTVEGGALCNPSAVAHPDQSGLAAGSLRVVMAVRAIGEGHVSSIGFATAVIGPGSTWVFDERELPLARARIGEGHWDRAHLREALEHEGRLNEISSAIIRDLPEQLTTADVERAIGDLSPELIARPDARSHLVEIRQLVYSAYSAEFRDDHHPSRRILLPTAEEESHGMEDARFVRFERGDGGIEYRATYTAYDGKAIAPRLIVTPDFVTFTTHRFTGPAATNKGMALFPRMIAGEHWSLTRSDGETTSIARSPDGLSWQHAVILHRPDQLWEVAKSGNCGAPIETERGWLVLTHGVGPMRRYSIGAILLDLDDPTIVRARLRRPLLQPAAGRQDGYVPNVVYSCGGIVHEGVLWLPYGVNDDHIRVASVPIEDLLDAMTSE
jgi:predicted GH43/DUF377 family glycosyl hydrolase